MEDDFDGVIKLGASVHGEGYLDHVRLADILQKSVLGKYNCSYVVYDTPTAGVWAIRKPDNLVGFRLTYAPGLWEIDEWCSPDKWRVPPEKVCYFKSNTIREDARGKQVGRTLLEISKDTAVRMGAVAGATHIWMQSPNGSAFGYFTKVGGKTIKHWPNRWSEDYEKNGYVCTVDGKDCSCDATEMILYFGEQNE